MDLMLQTVLHRLLPTTLGLCICVYAEAAPVVTPLPIAPPSPHLGLFSPQYNKILEYIDHGKSEGAKLQ
jgi:hypothetical protein